MPYFVYILLCSDGTYYTGATSDVQKRVKMHNFTKAGAHYTKIRRPVTLVYSEICESYSQARKREAEIKRMTRKEKELLTGDIV